MTSTPLLQHLLQDKSATRDIRLSGGHDSSRPDTIRKRLRGLGGHPGRQSTSHNTTSTAAGHPEGYPVSLELFWVGEYQVRVLAGVWTDWARFSGTLAETFPDTYEVVEVRSKLSG